MDTWLWIVLWAAVIATIGLLWLRERGRGKGWRGTRPGADVDGGEAETHLRGRPMQLP